MKYHTLKISLPLLFFAFFLVSCSEEQPSPDIIDERQEMLDVMNFTAQLVSQVSAINAVKQELLSYDLEKYGGEVTAHFSELLSNESSRQRNGRQGVINGSFATLFRPRAERFNDDQKVIRSESSNSAQTDLEAYLVSQGMALYGPYLAERHASSTKPVTVSFDPLDETKSSNIGYMFVPKANSQGSSANLGGTDSRMDIDDFELVEVNNVDDDYAYENPTIFVIPDDGNVNIPNSTNNNNTSNDNRDIDCRVLTDDDIVQLYMRQFKLNGNLRGAPWLRNLLDMWVITGDDISFDTNNTAIVNENTAKMWRSKQVSRSDGRNGKWLSSGIGALDLNWGADEVNAYMILAYKSGSDGGTVTANVKTMLKSDGTNETTTTLNATILLKDKYESFFQFPYDRCGTLAVFKTDQGLGKHDNLSIFGADKMQFTLEAIVR